MPRQLIVGNWKMNGLLADALARCAELRDTAGSHTADMVICPPATLLHPLKNEGFKLGAQDCHAAENGAHTGDIAVSMLKDAGCDYVILGHSERRQNHGESSVSVAAKAKTAHAAGLITIICVGETDAERSAGTQDAVVAAQIAASVPDCATAENTVLAYEPVWAIGTGKVASVDDVMAMHAFIRGFLREKLSHVGEAAILYGGSVKADNAAEILKIKDVGGVLVGGASLKPAEFAAIAKAAV